MYTFIGGQLAVICKRKTTWNPKKQLFTHASSLYLHIQIVYVVVSGIFVVRSKHYHQKNVQRVFYPNFDKKTVCSVCVVVCHRFHFVESKWQTASFSKNCITIRNGCMMLKSCTHTETSLDHTWKKNEVHIAILKLFYDAVKQSGVILQSGVIRFMRRIV